jgi:hypothetical protein
MLQTDYIYFTGGIDTDSEDRYVAAGDYRFSRFLRGGNPTDSTEGGLTTIKGNVLYINELPEGDNICVGGCKWIE